MTTKTLRVSEDTLNSWAKGPGKTEADKCENAERVIKSAIKSSAALKDLNISVFAQGSYGANTNIGVESDVDICVRYDDAFFPYYPEGTDRSTFGNSPSDISFGEFKDAVHQALIDRFGRQGVERGDKAFDVHENSYRVHADVVATFQYRHYYSGTDGKYYFREGVAFRTDEEGKLIHNYPQQTYDNGKNRNVATSMRYKKVIRVLKNLRTEMSQDGIPVAGDFPSFLIECLVWNVEDHIFLHDTHTERLRNVLLNL